MRRLRLRVRPDEHGTPVRTLLLGRGGLAPEQAAAALAAGGVTVNRRRVRDPATPLSRGDEVVASLEERGASAGAPRSLDPQRLLYCDAQLVAVDKPPGIPAQGTPTDAQAGLDAAVSALLRDRGERRPEVNVVHRLDRETSGVTVFGRTAEATRHLAEQFREGRASKRYLALTAGLPPWEEQLVDAPLGAAPGGGGRQRVRSDGSPARTLLRRLDGGSASGVSWSLLEALPETGRTHQIRVHAAHLGFPLLGDVRYGGPAQLTAADGTRLEVPRVALHAQRLEVEGPGGERLRLEASWPVDLEALLARLRALAPAQPPPA